MRIKWVNAWGVISTEPGAQYADTIVTVVAEVVTVMTKKLQWKKKPGITKGMELAQGDTASKGQS